MRTFGRSSGRLPSRRRSRLRCIRARAVLRGLAGRRMSSRPVVECRSSPGLVAVRSQAGTTNGRSIGGYAVVFGRLSKSLGGFVETVSPGALNRSRGNGWPGVMARYEQEVLLGTAAAGTLRLSIDATGLLYEVDVPRSREDVLELVQR